MHQKVGCPSTGYERDSETGLDYAFARYYSSRLGRFLSTDPLGGSVGDLQSHNAYAYVENNPLNATDPAGMSGAASMQCPPGVHAPVCAGSGPGGTDCILDGIETACDDALFAAGIRDEFDLLNLAFTPTGGGEMVQNPNLDDCPPGGDCPIWVQSPFQYGNIGLLSLLGAPGGSSPFVPTETKFPPKAVRCNGPNREGETYLTEGQLMTPDGKPAPPGTAILSSNLVRSTPGIKEETVIPVSPKGEVTSSEDVFSRYLSFNLPGLNGTFTYHWEVTYMYRRKKYPNVPSPERTVGCASKT